MDKKVLIQHFYEKEKNIPDQPYLNQPFGESWEVYTWGEVGQMARRLATHIGKQGLVKGSHIGLVSKNCREWIIADLAIMMAEMVSVPFFPTLNGDQLAEVMEIGDVQMLFVGKTEVWTSMKQGVPVDMPVVSFPTYADHDVIDMGIGWEKVLEESEPIQGEPCSQIDDLWTIIFTSGTTGTPKGVMHDYNNVHEMVTHNQLHNPLKVSFEGDNRFFSYLPLNHIAERNLEMISFVSGGEMFFTESLARFAANLKDARPTTFFGVPRIWTKFMQGVLASLPQEKLDHILQDPVQAESVRKGIQANLGLDNTRIVITGAAPLPQQTKDWYASIGLPLTEAYGMTENFAFCSFLQDIDDRPKSVGRPMNTTEVRIHEETGEILTKAPWTMLGYYKSPVKTAETIIDGWLYTGDKGRLDDEGYIYIIGRVKDTFKTAKGEFIIPSDVEEKFSINNDIETLCLLGLGMPQPILVVSPSELGLAKSKEDLNQSLSESLLSVNQELPNYTRVATVVVIKDPLSVENGTLTPTLKVKRSKVHEKYCDHLTGFCAHTEHVLWEA